MAYERVVPDATEEKNEGPTVAEVQADAERKQAEFQAKVAQEKAVLDAKMEALERNVGQRFAERPQTVAPAAQQAREELNLSDEEILANPKAAVARVADYITQQRLAEQNTRNAEIFGNLADTAYRSQIQMLSQKEFYADLEPYINDYFQRNPQERLTSGRPEQYYNELVGANAGELYKRKAARDAEAAAAAEDGDEREFTRQRAASPNLSTPGLRGPEADDGVEDSDVELLGDHADVKAELIGIFNELGVNLSAKEWSEIEAGKVFPKKIAADWQSGGRK